MPSINSSFITKAQNHWTSERVAKITGGKKILLKPNEAPLLLRVMGLLNEDGSMSANHVRKYRQINHMLALMVPDLEHLTRNYKILRILDVGCGNSYLTLLLAWYFREKFPHPVEILGVDYNSKVVQASQERANILGYEQTIKFFGGNIKNLQWEQFFPESHQAKIHAVIALHACDTATDYALEFGIKHFSDYIAVAPCCQAELAQQWKKISAVDQPWSPIFHSPHFRREIAAQMTDIMRMLLVRSQGYEVTPTEFVPLEHSHKNRLITCIRRGKSLQEAFDQFSRLKSSLGGSSILLDFLLGGPFPPP